ncbi:DUF2294 family protein [Alicyclobacillus sp. TC]|nr:DUF2294 family protein [Alicyclobacillus sp. TC]
MGRGTVNQPTNTTESFNQNDFHQTISNRMSKLFREHFGKGPESVFVSSGYKFISIYLRNFLSPMEKVLLENDQDFTLAELRQQVMQALLPEIKAYIEMLSGIKIEELYYDWNFHNRSGLIFAVTDNPLSNIANLEQEFEGKKLLEDEIIRISQNAQKVPEEVFSFLFHPKILVIIRKGILVRIEKELIRVGHGPLLKRVKANLEKSYLHNTSSFEGILKQRVLEVFVDWNFDIDKSIIVYILNPKRLQGQGDKPMVERADANTFEQEDENP